MSREEFIGKLEMVYVGDRNAFNDIVCAYDGVLSANEKAIEYINTGEILDVWGKYKPFKEFGYGKDLLNILQNGSEDNV